MIPFLGFVAVAILAVSLFNWRLGLLLCLAVGFVQDPVRKLIPGRPVALVVAVAVCFGFCLVGLLLSGERLALRRLVSWFPRVRPPAAIFLAVVLVQSVVTLARAGSPVLVGIGLLSYLSPPLALLLSERYAADFDHLLRWLKWYLAGALVAGGSVLLQYVGWESSLFATVGFEWVYTEAGAVRMLNGLMRTSEIAAWHAAAGACLLTAFAIGARRQIFRWLGGGAAAGLVVAVFLTGRRKMLAEIALFAILYVVLVVQYRRGGSRVLQFASAAIVLTLVSSQLGLLGDGSGVLGTYVERGVTVFGDAGARLELMTLGMLESIVSRNGLLGSGTGTGAQGSQYFGGGTQIIGGAAEGGLGKVLAELGLPGLVALGWLGFELARVVLRVARFVRHAPSHRALPLFGLIAFLPANAAVFLTAHQVYGDPFVLIVLGLVTGSILAYPRIVLVESRKAAALRSAGPPAARSAA